MKSSEPRQDHPLPLGTLEDQPTAGLPRRTLASGFLFGCGIAASMIDLFIFHLGLHWHHFYDLSTREVALTADGFFHAVGWFITIWGVFLFADIRRRASIVWARWVGAVLVGIGFFQLFDGLIDHKVLRIHQIRYGVNLLPYNVIWNGTAVVVLLIGVLVVLRARPHRGDDAVMTPAPPR